jgi:hypothetical protein
VTHVMRRTAAQIASWPTGVKAAVVGLLAFVGLAGWAVSSPVGSSPDDDFHLSSIWCAPGQGCDLGEQGMLVPTEVVLSPCYAFDSAESAACQRSIVVDAPERVDWTHGNYHEHLYPGGFYQVMSVLAGDDVATSVRMMRLLNAAIFVFLVTALWASSPRPLRTVVSWTLLATAVPLALFVVPSTNPSSWAFTSAYVTLVAFAGALNEGRGKHAWRLALIAVAGTALGVASRADSALFVLVALGIAMLVVRPGRRAWPIATVVVVPAVVAAVAALLSSRQSMAATQGLAADGGSGRGVGALQSIVMNMPRVLDLVQGAVGGWGLGWLDAPMPQSVSVMGVLVLGAVFFSGLRSASLRRLVLVAVVSLMVVAYPLVVLAQTEAAVGEFFQPRYLFPVLVLAVIVAVLPTKGSVLHASPAQAVLLSLVLTFSAALSQYAMIRRFVTGVDIQMYSLDRNAEWWGGPWSPMTVWLATAFVLGLTILALAWSTVHAPTDADGPGTAAEEAGPVPDLAHETRLKERTGSDLAAAGV